jgi:multidrug efflux pump subunit AcrB
MIPIEITYSLAFLFYISVFLIHVLVLNGKISFKLVNGGRSKNFKEQQKQSQVSILIVVIFFIYVLGTMLFPSFRGTIVFLVITSLLVLLWLLGTLMQLLGTKFEKRVVVWINLIGLCSHILLLISYFE